jgi:tetratricopeptide (TPR) repeat protein
MGSVENTAGDAQPAIDRAIHAFNHWRVDVMEHVGAALAADAQAPMAHAVKGLVLATGRNARYREMVESSLAAARASQDRLPPRECGYVDALQASSEGRLNDAVVHYEGLLARKPDDLFAHRLIQQELFWMGEGRWMADVAERAAPAWSDDDPDYGMFQSVRAFSLEEAGDYARAERFAREAVERDPGDCWGAHAAAHVLLMQGRMEEGMAWLEALSGNWAGGNQIVHHLWWHLCLFLLERGDHARILELLDREVRNPASPLVQAVPDAYIDIQNVASLLLRLELRGVNVGERWQGVAEVAEQRIGNHASAFTDAHAAMILAAAGEMEKAEALVASMDAFAAADRGSLGPRYRSAAIPAARAAIAHRRGDHRAVARALLPARRALWQMGGSHAQRDVFSQMLVDSLAKLGESARIATVLDEIRAVPFERLGERTLYREATLAA